jgi:hypothetical protein
MSARHSAHGRNPLITGGSQSRAVGHVIRRVQMGERTIAVARSHARQSGAASGAIRP